MNIFIVILILCFVFYFFIKISDNNKKEEIKKMFSEKQFGFLNKEKFELHSETSHQEMLEQVKNFENILEGGQDPRILNLENKFSFIQRGILNNTKKQINNNYGPLIIQYLRKYQNNNNLSLDCDEIREKLGYVSFLGSKSKERIEKAVRESSVIDEKIINDIGDFVMQNIKNN